MGLRRAHGAWGGSSPRRIAHVALVGGQGRIGARRDLICAVTRSWIKSKEFDVNPNWGHSGVLVGGLVR